MLLSIILQATEAVKAVSYVPAITAIAAAITVIGAAFGISKIGQSAMEAIARQPEAGGRVFTSMIIAGAFVEGVSLFAIVVCLLAGQA